VVIADNLFFEEMICFFEGAYGIDATYMGRLIGGDGFSSNINAYLKACFFKRTTKHI